MKDNITFAQVNYRKRNRAQGLVQLRKFITEQQREDFRAVLDGRAQVVYYQAHTTTQPR